MVRHSTRNRYGGRHGGHGRSRPIPSSDSPVAPESPPSAHAIQPQPSSVCKPFAHNTFQTTHFKFQSSLNKPILSASITIIFAEEEALPSVYVHTSETHSQGDHGSEQYLVDEGNVINCGDLHVEGNVPDDTQPPDGSLQGVSGSVDPADSSCGKRRSSAHPGGSGMDEEVKEGECWFGNACPVVEEDPVQDAVV